MENNSKKMNAQLLDAYKKSNIPKAKRLFKKGASPNLIINKDGKTLFMKAAQDGSNGMVKTMLDYNADIHLVDTKLGLNAFLYACWAGEIKTAKTLLDAGSEISALTYNKTNALMLAATNNHDDFVDFLCEKGIDINAQDEKGQTVLRYVLNKCKKEETYNDYDLEEFPFLEKNLKESI